MRLKALQHNN